MRSIIAVSSLVQVVAAKAPPLHLGLALIPFYTARMHRKSARARLLDIANYFLLQWLGLLTKKVGLQTCYNVLQ